MNVKFNVYCVFDFHEMTTILDFLCKLSACNVLKLVVKFS